MTAIPVRPIANTAGADLSPEAIERSLQQLWREMREAEVEVTQVRMLNLIVYLPAPPSPEAHAAIASVAVRHPGRTITLFFDDGLPHAAATIACRVGEGLQRACGELISLHGSVNGRPLHSLAIALLQAGLPVTIWWHGPLDFDDHLFLQFANVADRVVVDSRTWSDRLGLLPRLSKIAEEWGQRLQFSDLQWGALTGWRRIIAHCFDVPDARAALSGLTELTIEYGGADRLSIGALLVAGWLLSRLGWKLEPDTATREPRGFSILARQGGATSERLKIAFAPRDGEEEGIRAVRMRTGGDRPASFTFEYQPANGCVRTRIEMAARAPIVQVSHLRELDAADLLGEELALTRADPVYRAALQEAGELVDHLEAAL